MSPAACTRANVCSVTCGARQFSSSRSIVNDFCSVPFCSSSSRFLLCPLLQLPFCSSWLVARDRQPATSIPGAGSLRSDRQTATSMPRSGRASRRPCRHSERCWICSTSAMTVARILGFSLLAACSNTGSSTDAGANSEQCPSDIATGHTCSAAGAVCSMEGTATCDQPPAGGICNCIAGSWSCESGCAPGCPEQRPEDAAACSVEVDRECRYWYPMHATCRCTAGAFACTE
ncbi:hypothetical protein BH11MYX2_BH11MYX2_21980 [soil metagenome]